MLEDNDVKRYYVGARLLDVILSVIALGFGIALPIVIANNPNIKFSELGNSLVLIIILLVIGVMWFLLNLVLIFRQIMAIKYGKETFGRIVKIKRGHSRSGFRYSVIIAYHNAEGEEFESSVPISYWDRDDYSEGEEVSVYVWKNYGYLVR